MLHRRTANSGRVAAQSRMPNPPGPTSQRSKRRCLPQTVLDYSGLGVACASETPRLHWVLASAKLTVGLLRRRCCQVNRRIDRIFGIVHAHAADPSLGSQLGANASGHRRTPTNAERPESAGNSTIPDVSGQAAGSLRARTGRHGSEPPPASRSPLQARTRRRLARWCRGRPR